MYSTLVSLNSLVSLNTYLFFYVLYLIRDGILKMALMILPLQLQDCRGLRVSSAEGFRNPIQ